MLRAVSGGGLLVAETGAGVVMNELLFWRWFKAFQTGQSLRFEEAQYSRYIRVFAPLQTIIRTYPTISFDY
jgi:hypothetical protein